MGETQERSANQNLLGETLCALGELCVERIALSGRDKREQ
jgi:hypothetical protein